MSRQLKSVVPASVEKPAKSPNREAELLQGTLDLLILRIVALEPLHGYGIVQRIQQMSRDALQVRQGSLYPALYRMEAKGLLAPEWRTHESGKEAKYYSLTKAGREALKAETDSWKRLRGAIDLILESELVPEGEA